MPIQAFGNNWILETQRTAYAFGTHPAGLLAHRYWGARLPYPTDYPVDWSEDRLAAGSRVLQGYHLTAQAT